MIRGDQTRERILEGAIRLASVEGLRALSIGRLAEALDLSKSGLIAHFGSKESLQAEVVRSAADLFEDLVLRPSLEFPEGERRLRQIYKLWVAWGGHESMPGGCLFNAVASELDDQPSPARDVIEGWTRRLRTILGDQVKAAIALGEFREEIDPQQFSFEMGGIMLAMHRTLRLLRDKPGAIRLGGLAFDRLLGWAKK